MPTVTRIIFEKRQTLQILLYTTTTTNRLQKHFQQPSYMLTTRNKWMWRKCPINFVTPHCRNAVYAWKEQQRDSETFIPLEFYCHFAFVLQLLSTQYDIRASHRSHLDITAVVQIRAFHYTISNIMAFLNFCGNGVVGYQHS